MAVVLKNNAGSSLLVAAAAADTEIQVLAIDASKFPVLETSGDWFPVRLRDSGGNSEYVRCTARTGNRITVQRGQEGSVARDFPAGASVHLVVTAGAWEEMTNDAANAALDVANPAINAIVEDAFAARVASTTVAGIIKQSTGPQAVAGTDDTTAMSPADVTSRLTAQWIAAATVTNFNTLTKPGSAWVVIYNAANTNAPVSGNIYWLVECNSYSATYLVQRAQSLSSTDSQTWVRVCNNGTWSAWRRLAVLGAVQGYTRQQYAEPVALTGQSGAVALNADNHQDVEVTATGNITFSAPTNSVKGKTIFLTLTAASALTITWDSVFKGNADIATLDAVFVANKRIFLQFRCIDGTNWVLMGRAQEA